MSLLNINIDFREDIGSINVKVFFLKWCVKNQTFDFNGEVKENDVV